MLSFEQPIAKRPLRAEQPVKQESADDTPEILAAEMEEGLAEGIRAVARDEISDRVLTNPTLDEYALLAQQFREDLQKPEMMEADKVSSENLSNEYGGNMGYAEAVKRGSEQQQAENVAKQAAEAKETAEERQAQLAELAEQAERIKKEGSEENVRNLFEKEVDEKVERARKEKGGTQHLSPEVFGEWEVDRRLKKVPPPTQADPEQLFRAFQTATSIEKSKQAGVAQGALAEASIERRQQKPSDIASALEGIPVKPAVVEGLSEAEKQTAEDRAERGGIFSLQDLMNKFPEES